MPDEPINCPICKSKVQELDRTGDSTGFDCGEHGKFKVAGTVFGTVKEVGREQWERALRLATRRAKLNEWPVIRHFDFQ
jgi:hypothetical protein